MEPDFTPELTPTESFLSQHPKTEAFFPGLIFAVLASLVSILCWQDPALRQSLVSTPHAVFENHEWYRALTSILVHSNLKHLLGNLLFIVPFAGLLNFYFSWRLFPLASLLLGMVTQLLALKTYPAQLGLQGASGMLYVMFGLWLALYYHAESHIPRRKRWLRVAGFCLIMMVPSEFAPHVSYRTHLIGLLVGLFAGASYAIFFTEELEQRNLEYRRRG